MTFLLKFLAKKTRVLYPRLASSSLPLGVCIQALILNITDFEGTEYWNCDLALKDNFPWLL